MALVDFTSLNDIRAALGVSSLEIGDATISLPLYENNLAAELDDVSLTLATDYVTTKAKGTKTDAENRFLRAMQLFATYVVAKHLTSSLPLFSPKEITDGKSALVRYAQNPYKDTITEVNKRYEAYKSRVEAAYAELSSTTTAPAEPRPYLSVVSPSYDPISGE